MAFSPDGATVAAGTFRGSVAVWDAVSGKPLGDVPGHSSQVTAVAFSPTGRRIFSGDAGGQVRVWNFDDSGAASEESELVAQFDAHGSSIHAMAAASEHSLVTVGDEAVGEWDLSRSHVRRSLPGGRKQALDIVVAGNLLVSTAPGGRLRAWELATERVEDIARGSEQSNAIFALAATPERRLAAARLPGGIELWDLADDALVDRLPGQTITDVAISGDGRLVVAADFGDGAIVWQPDADVEPVKRIEQSGVSFPVALTSDGERMAYAAGSVVHLRGPRGDPNVRTIDGIGGGVADLAFSPDGTLLVVGTSTGNVQVYDADRLNLRHAFQDPTGQVEALAFDRAGGILAAGTSDGVIHLSDVATGERLAELGERRPFRPVYGLVFAPDGRLFAATEDGVVVWDLRRDALRAAACRLAGRNLTKAESERYLPGRPAIHVCPEP